MMRLLSDQDHQALCTDNTLVMSVDDCQHLHAVSPYRLGVRPQYVRRDQHGIHRVCPGGMLLSIIRIVPAGTQMPSGYRYQCGRIVGAIAQVRLLQLRAAVFPSSRIVFHEWGSYWLPCTEWRLGQADRHA
jgi:hypothetical protein